MDVEKCKEFVVLARTRNYLKASEQLFISQSSLSKHIKSLEHELGVTLFVRSTRSVDLSPAGRVFLPYAQKITRVDNEMLAALSDVQENELHVLDIGSIPIMVPYGITGIMARYEHDNPTERIRLFEGDADELREALRQDRLELAFIREWDGDASKDSGDEEFGTVPYDEDRLVAVLPVDHPLAGRQKVMLGELADEDFLLLPKGSVMHALILDACAIEGFVPRVRYQGRRGENIIDLVGRGMGVSLLMRKPAAYLATPDVVLVDVEPTITTEIKVYYLRGREPSPAARRFLDAVSRSGAAGA